MKTSPLKIFGLTSLLIFLCFKSNSADASGIVPDTNKRDEIDQYLSDLARERNFSGALLIVKEGEKFFSKGYGWADKENKVPFTPQTLASIGSITKAFTAAAILKLKEENKLSPEDRLERFFPDVPKDKANITIHQLLTHSSGFGEFLTNDGGDYARVEKKEFITRAFDDTLAFEPGSKAVYSNVGYSILGIIIEQIAGAGYETFLRQNLFIPLEIKEIGYHFPPVSKNPIAVGYRNGNRWGTHQQRFEKAGGGPFWNLKANGGLLSSLDDMFLWINGVTSRKVLSQESVNKLFYPHIVEDGSEGRTFFGYGCNVSRSRRNTTVISNGGSNGIFFAQMFRFHDEGVVFFMVTNERSMNAGMVLPNITQLYFQGEIVRDFTHRQPGSQ
ncbi:MAG TPA: serine hydrolase domain-containing protein [Bacteroidales bacterium]|nr:serine hydrolase domain-containing protein [Bacteroidales bacterium]